jgi:hypothetical protein
MYRIWSNQRKQTRETREQGARINKIDEQVTNTHNTNLRDDVDKTTSAATRGAEAAERAAVAAEKALEIATRLEVSHAETRKDIGGIREEQREQRKETLNISTRLDESVVERRKQIREVREEMGRVNTRLDEHLKERE